MSCEVAILWPDYWRDPFFTSMFIGGRGQKQKKITPPHQGGKKHTFQSLLCHGIPSYHSNLPMTPHQYHDTRDRCGPTGLSVSDPWENSWPPKIRTCCRRSWCQRGALGRFFSFKAPNKEKRRSWDPDPHQNHPRVPRDAMNPWKSLQNGYRNLPANEGTPEVETAIHLKIWSPGFPAKKNELVLGKKTSMGFKWTRRQLNKWFWEGICDRSQEGKLNFGGVSWNWLPSTSPISPLRIVDSKLGTEPRKMMKCTNNGRTKKVPNKDVWRDLEWWYFWNSAHKLRYGKYLAKILGDLPKINWWTRQMFEQSIVLTSHN